MTRRDRDLVLRAAFETLDQAERAHFERLVEQDADARSEYRKLTGVRSGLKGLREMPECQLSTEHLRNAILASQASEKPKRSLVSRWAAPVGLAAGVAFLAFAVGRFSAQPEPATMASVVDPSLPVETIVAAEPAPQIDDPLAFAVRQVALAASQRTVVDSPTEPVVPQRRAQSVRRAPAVSVPVTRESSGASEPSTVAAAPEPALEPAPVEVSQPEPIVVVPERAQPSSRIHVATELSPSSDVVFGF